MCIHDPFKSDIYSLGLSLLMIYVIKIKKFKNKAEIFNFFDDAIAVENYTNTINLNRFFFK